MHYLYLWKDGQITVKDAFNNLIAYLTFSENDESIKILEIYEQENIGFKNDLKKRIQLYAQIKEKILEEKHTYK